ncbi:HesA/MoeB/ThiF family protein [Tautonia plasticadhaerens]|uniref:Sulfur carrier protein ThiS adenylyltransferase n=1 Tax=Tautonia plasticadhaerens TaxID=2527974 RepID=A0A518GVR6_9BACT|nr:ThiF family adenylyltransferase [Tautonia plasticadhaerens]QDV32680.1 Sulfur carrier protein ThiS adenylyltransferase [Tautonia plasticadhaerens]
MDSLRDEDSDVLRIDDDDRYGRLRLISWWRQDRLAAAKVLVVGAGALGNEVMKNLALLGVGTIVLIDLDEVEPSNLARSVLFRREDGGKSKAFVAAARAKELNPDVTIIPIHGDVLTDLGLGLFAEMDVVVGCLDNREARLWVNRQCWKVGTPWVDAGIQEIQGVVRVFVPPDSACYECGMTSRDYQLLNLRYSCPLLRREDIQAGKVPTAPTIASMMAAMEVQEALKLIHGMPVQSGCLHVFNGVSNTFYTTQLPRKEDCLSHETYPGPIPVDLGNDATAEQMFHVAHQHLSGPLSLALDRDLVTAIDWPQLGRRSEILRPRTRVTLAEATDPETGEAGRPELVSVVDEGTGLSRRTLAELGVPPYDIVRADGAGGSAFLRLEGDRGRALPGI